MTRRRLLLGVGVLALLGVAGAALWSAGRTSGISRLNYLRICAGMTPPEVDALLGGPPGVYRTDGKAVYSCGSWLHTPGQRRASWYGDAGDIYVVFDPHERVVERQWYPRERTAMDNVLRWLER